ncbi:ATP-dependent DNA helicase pif1-like [Octopus sinensis]|uniref:ATP-dependent DNA helicase n=1 Tax=Octopus sinensis TaxID=2607531 RepID=A0A6P7U192_9MOLL|nr:ATP-dependent DNA helicase pif1-like [Octopus sinensis]
MPSKIRYLFTLMLAYCNISNPLQLWEKHKEIMCEDILKRDAKSGFDEDIFNEGLLIINRSLESVIGKNICEYGFSVNSQNITNNLEYDKYNLEELQKILNEREPNLLEGQLRIYNEINRKIEENDGKIFFIDAPGGTGKTYLLNLLLAKARCNNKIAIAVASTGIAATLLDGGRTAHSMFKLPLNLAKDMEPVCNIKGNSLIGTIIRDCNLIVWDECTMVSKRAFEAVDRTFRDIKHSDSPFGGSVLVLAGDFRQTLPIIQRGTPADELNACLKSSYLWTLVKKISLNVNIRAQKSETNSFAKVLLNVGNGTLETNSEDFKVSLPPELCINVNRPEELLTSVYPNLEENYTCFDWLRERAILAPLNDEVHNINLDLLIKLPGMERIYKSVDVIMDQETACEYPVEFLNSLEPSGMPHHTLKLKVGAPVVLLRNLESPRLCNGTRLVITNLMSNIIEATILTGKNKGEDVYIPKIPIISDELPFRFKRLQFPLKLSFAMTINKSQGQTLKVIAYSLKFTDEDIENAFVQDNTILLKSTKIDYIEENIQNLNSKL